MSMMKPGELLVQYLKEIRNFNSERDARDAEEYLSPEQLLTLHQKSSNSGFPLRSLSRGV